MEEYGLRRSPAKWAMGLPGKTAHRLSRTRIGDWALAGKKDLDLFRGRPSPRVWLGLGLIASSYVMGPASLALCGYLAVEHGGTWHLAALGAGLFVAVHLVFALGVYLAGANQAKALVRWGLGRFLRRYMPG